MNAGLVFWTVQKIIRLDYSNEFGTFFSWGDYYMGYLWMVVIANIIYFVLNILAAIKARKGLMYYYFFFGKIAYHRAFIVKTSEGIKSVNLPPTV